MTGSESAPNSTEDRGTVWLPCVLILATAVFAVHPLLRHGNTCGNDFDFHLLSWMEAARSWSQGTLYPHWAQSANYGAGEPRFVFYPPLSWALGAFLGIVSSWAAAPILFVLATLAGYGAAMYALAREWASRRAATLAACLYIVNPYAMFVVYERSALGELLAGVWIPLAFLFALRQRRRHSAAGLALAVAATWLSDAPAGVMICYALAFAALAMALAEKRLWPLWRAAAGTALGLALAAFYLVPAAFEQRWVEIARAIVPGIRIEDSFLFERTGQSYHDHLLRIASWIFVLELAAALLAASVAWRKRSGGNGRIVFTALLPVLFILQLRISGFLWHALPRLDFLQFPWRWLLILSVSGAVLLAMAASPAPERLQASRGRTTSRWRTAAAIVPVLASVAVCAHLFFQPCDDEDVVSAQAAVFHAGTGVQGTDEYTPASAVNEDIQQDLPAVRVLRHPRDEAAGSADGENPEWSPQPGEELPAQVRILRWQTERREIAVLTQAPGFAVLRLMDYPAWRVTVNGQLLRSRPHREDGLMTIPLSSGASTIRIWWRTTPGEAAGRIVSAVALAILIALLLRSAFLQPEVRPGRQIS